MNWDLTAEQGAIRDLAREFAEGVVAPGASARDESGEFAMDIMRQLGEQGFFAIPWSEAYGGSGGDYLSYALAVEEISRADAGLGLSYAAHVSLGMGPVYYAGTEEQKQRWLPGAARGEYLASFGLTEPEAGSDSGNTRTTAVRDGNHWVLDGQKAFITNGGYAGYIVCTAMTEKGKGNRGISNFIVPTNAPGFSYGQPYKKMGLRSSDTRPLFFDKCRLPDECLLGQPGQGFKQFMVTLDGGRISVAAFCIGIAQAAYEASLGYAKERVQFGQAIAKFQAIQFKLADMAMEIELARNQVWKAAWLKDHGRPFGKEAAMAKLFASEMATRVCNQALQIHGGFGYMQEGKVERYYRDVKLGEIGEGTSEVQRMVIARQIGC